MRRVRPLSLIKVDKGYDVDRWMDGMVYSSLVRIEGGLKVFASTNVN